MIFDKSFRAREPTEKSTIQTETTQEESMTLTKLVECLGLQGVKPDRLSEATYFACLRILSESLGKLPLRLMKSEEKGGKSTQPRHTIYDMLRNRPNPFCTATAFWTSMEQARNHYGNCYAHIQDTASGTRLWQLPSQKVDIWWDNARILENTPHIWYRYSAPNGKRYIYSDEEVIHLRTWLSLDGVKGLAVKDILKLTLDGSLESQKMLNRLYENGMAGKAVINYTGDLNDDNEQVFLKKIQNYIDGTVDASKTLIPIPPGSELVPLNIKLADSQFLELRKYTALQVAAAFGVKPDQINDYEKSSYSSSEAQQLAFLVETLLWIVENYEQEISYKLLTAEERADGLAAKFNTGVILRTTPDKQMEALTKAVTNSVYTPNEARDHLDMVARPEGNRLYAANGSVIPLELAGKQYDKKGGNTDE